MIFINADEIAKTLNGASVNGASVEQVNLRAGRIMLERLNDLADSKIDFALETTLANRSLAGRIQAWKQMGYQFTLLFLMLPSADVAVQRVKARVASGGHDVPEETIRRRYTLGLKNFFFLYLPIADVWASTKTLSWAGIRSLLKSRLVKNSRFSMKETGKRRGRLQEKHTMIQQSREEVLERINNRKVRDKYLHLAIRNAYAEHKRNGTSIVVWKDGEVVTIPADEIVVPDAEE